MLYNKAVFAAFAILNGVQAVDPAGSKDSKAPTDTVASQSLGARAKAVPKIVLEAFKDAQSFWTGYKAPAQWRNWVGYSGALAVILMVYWSTMVLGLVINFLWWQQSMIAGAANWILAVTMLAIGSLMFIRSPRCRFWMAVVSFSLLFILFFTMWLVFPVVLYANMTYKPVEFTNENYHLEWPYCALKEEMRLRDKLADLDKPSDREGYVTQYMKEQVRAGIHALDGQIYKHEIISHHDTVSAVYFKPRDSGDGSIKNLVVIADGNAVDLEFTRVRRMQLLNLIMVEEYSPALYTTAFLLLHYQNRPDDTAFPSEDKILAEGESIIKEKLAGESALNKISFHGASLGCAVVSGLAAKVLGDEDNAAKYKAQLVLISPFTSTPDLVNKGAIKLPQFVVQSWFYQVFWGMVGHSWNNRLALDALPIDTDLAIFHGKQDSICSYSMGEELAMRWVNKMPKTDSKLRVNGQKDSTKSVSIGSVFNSFSKDRNEYIEQVGHELIATDIGCSEAMQRVHNFLTA